MELLMRVVARASAAVLILLAGVQVVSAQTTAPGNAAEIAEGRRVFHQKCALCHVANTLGEESYGPKLSRVQVDKSEEGVRQVIRTGLARMPGFQYALEPRQLDALIALLKTLETPPARVVVKTAGP
jgi:mono/diheme cytochrome c family protein